MLLNARDRIELMQLLPAESDVLTLRLVRELRTRFGFTEEEIAVLEIKRDGNQIVWKASADEPKEIEIGDAAAGVIRDALKKLSDAKKMKIEQVELYDRFMQDKGDK